MFCDIGVGSHLLFHVKFKTSNLFNYSGIHILCTCVFGLAGIILEISSLNFVFFHNFHTPNQPPGFKNCGWKNKKKFLKLTFKIHGFINITSRVLIFVFYKKV